MELSKEVAVGLGDDRNYELAREVTTGRAYSDTSVVPSGFRIEAYAIEIVADESWRLTVWPARPARLILAFCPGVPIDTVTGAPPTETLPVASAGTS